MSCDVRQHLSPLCTGQGAFTTCMPQVGFLFTFNHVKVTFCTFTVISRLQLFILTLTLTKTEYNRFTLDWSI